MHDEWVAYDSARAPSTPTEVRIAMAWSEVLNLPVERIGRDDDFFRRGGTSLGAVRLLERLDRQVSLSQLCQFPVLRDLATAVDRGAEPDAPLLHDLTPPITGPDAHLVCLPDAGGNALNFHRPAEQLAAERIAVHAVEPPGHDVGAAHSDLLPLDALARRAAHEIGALSPAPVMLWGQGCGAALAVSTARLLEASGRAPERVFLGELPLEPVEDLRAEMKLLAGMSNRQVAGLLHAGGSYIEVGGRKAERMELVGQAYRHDVYAADDFLIAAQQRPARHRLDCPVHVVVPAAAEDRGFRRWQLLAGTVTLHRVASREPAGVVLSVRSTAIEEGSR
ncbi:hypothetical protein ACTI_45310 [Actinoplanes sp. OR16]|uniref:thioesterase II family protein n=1 Tax=Actinoplanes sp. OR16 TaxID=946334 RepID=UPI000F6CFC53|nr:thioesterase domain-containing protein [Actinoplanes sp. OR16]BBH67846.1 hypothetical protein ACTI_45310 [Actinoplanes sp. OR16]